MKHQQSHNNTQNLEVDQHALKTLSEHSAAPDNTDYLQSFQKEGSFKTGVIGKNFKNEKSIPQGINEPNSKTAGKETHEKS